METIPERIVEKTWQEVGGFSPDRAKKEMMKIASKGRGVRSQRAVAQKPNSKISDNLSFDK